MLNIIKIIILITITNCVHAAELEPVNAIPEGVKSVAAVVPVFSQKVSFNLPTNWKAVYENKKSGAYLIEFIPQDEVIEDWENLFTIQGFENLADKTTPMEFLNGMAARLRDVCGEHFVFEELGPISISGYKAFDAILGCAKMPEAMNHSDKELSELGYYVSIKGEQDYFLIHKMIRGDAFSKDELPINKSNAGDFISEFMPFDICQAGGEEHECNK